MAKKKLTSNKAKEILKDGSVHGHALTDKQKRYFGWIAGGGKAQDGETVLGTDVVGKVVTPVRTFNPRPVISEYFLNPNLEYDIYDPACPTGVGCSRQASKFAQSITGLPYERYGPGDAAYRDAIANAIGMKTIFDQVGSQRTDANSRSKNRSWTYPTAGDFSKWLAGDIVTLDAGEDVITYTPPKGFSEEDEYGNSHVGTIVGFTPKGVPIIRHGFKKGPFKGKYVEEPLGTDLRVQDFGHGRYAVKSVLRPREVDESGVVNKINYIRETGEEQAKRKQATEGNYSFYLKPTKEESLQAAYPVFADFSGANTRLETKNRLVNMFSDKALDKELKYKLGISDKDLNNLKPVLYGIAGQETSFNDVDHPFADAKDLFLNRLDVSNSKGLFQIRFDALSEKERKVLGIKSPNDLLDEKKGYQAALLLMHNAKQRMDKAVEKGTHPELKDKDPYFRAAYFYNTPRRAKRTAEEWAKQRGITDPEKIKKAELRMDKGSYPDKLKDAAKDLGMSVDLSKPEVLEEVVVRAPSPKNKKSKYVEIEKKEQGGYLGTTNKGFNYNPAWGGRWEDGGMIPIAQNGFLNKPMATSSRIKTADFSRLGVENKNNAISEDNDYRHYGTSINSYPNMINDTSYMYIRNNPKLPHQTEEFFYNTNQGKPVINMRRGKDFINPNAAEIEKYRKMIVDSVGGFQMGGSIPTAQVGKTTKSKKATESRSAKDYIESGLAATSLLAPNPLVAYGAGVLGSGIDFYDAYNATTPEERNEQMAEALLGLIPYGRYMRGMKGDKFWKTFKNLLPFQMMNKAVDVKDAVDPRLPNYQTGGSLPGMTGMMYARIGAPSNGPYAKKTKASAQNGGSFPVIDDVGEYDKQGIWVPNLKAMAAQAKKLGVKKVKTKSGAMLMFDNNWEVIGADDNPNAQNGMTFYQNGLDWKPRNISQNGGIYENLYKTAAKANPELAKVAAKEAKKKPQEFRKLTSDAKVAGEMYRKEYERSKMLGQAPLSQTIRNLGAPGQITEAETEASGMGSDFIVQGTPFGSAKRLSTLTRPLFTGESPVYFSKDQSAGETALGALQYFGDFGNVLPAVAPIRPYVEPMYNIASGVGDIPRATSVKEALGRIAGVPLRSDVPRMGAQDVKAMRQIQEISRMRDLGARSAEQMQYALANKLPENHFQQFFGRSTKEAKKLLKSGFKEREAQKSEQMRESLRSRLQRNPSRDVISSTTETSNLPVLDRERMIRMFNQINQERAATQATQRDRALLQSAEEYTARMREAMRRMITDPISSNEVLRNFSDADLISLNPTAKAAGAFRSFPQRIAKKMTNFLLSNTQDYPYYSGPYQQRVPGLALAGQKNLKDVSNQVFSSIEGLKSGDVFTGSTSTSHSSYLPQLKQVFKYKSGEPVFLGYRPMNSMGYLSSAGYGSDDIAAYLNSEIDQQIKRGVIPKNIQRPFVRGEHVVLPHYGIKQFKKGGKTAQDGITVDPMGYWNPDNWGEPVMIPSNEITMEGVDQPLLGISDMGDVQMMYPGEDYTFEGESVTEYPMAQNGMGIQDKGQLKKLDQLTNFTNYNNMSKAKKGKKLSKAQIGSYIGGEKAPIQQPMPLKDIYDMYDYTVSGKTDAIRREEAQAAAEQQQSSGGGGEEGMDLSNLVNLSKMFAAKKGFNLKKAQNSAQVMGNLKAAGVIPMNMGSYDQSYMSTDIAKDILANQKGGGGGGDLLQTISNIAGPAGAVYGAFKQVQEAVREKDKAKQFKNISEIVKKAAGTRPEQTKRKYVRPEDNLVNPGEMGSPYGMGTNFLTLEDGGEIANQIGGNPTEIQNMYNPGNIYSDLGFEPLKDSEIVKRYTYGGKAQAGQIVGQLANIAGNVASGIINIGTKKFMREGQQNLGQAALAQGVAGLQNQYGAFMENGGYLSHDWQPQVITQFGPHKLKDLLRPDDQSDIMRAGGQVRDIRSNYMGEDEELQMMPMGGQLKTHWGGGAELMSYNPYMPGSGETWMIKGQSHDESDGRGNTGVGMSYGGNMVEAERNEPVFEMEEGGVMGQKDTTAVISGNMKVPDYVVSELNDKKAKGKKFKHYIADLSKQEAKNNKKMEKSLDTLSQIKTDSAFDRLSANSAMATIEGVNMALKNIAAKKMTAAGGQDAILKTAEELGLDADALAKGKIKKAKPEDRAKYGKKMAQMGYQYPQQGAAWQMIQNDLPLPQFNIPPQIDPTQQTPQFKGNMIYEFPIKMVNNIPSKPVTPPGTFQFTDLKTSKWDNLSKALAVAAPYIRPTNQLQLDPNQLMPEMTALAMNQLEPVAAQMYQPMLEQPVEMSFQDQMNAIQADFNATQRLVGYNPTALSQLAAQKYKATSDVLGQQFRVNQAARMDVFNRNRQVLNDATLKNLAILDTQFQRQAAAKSATKMQAFEALKSIADKVAKNKLENRTLGVYENLYNYRFGPQGQAFNMNAPFMPNIPQVVGTDPQALRALADYYEKNPDKKKADGGKNGLIVKKSKNL